MPLEKGLAPPDGSYLTAIDKSNPSRPFNGEVMENIPEEQEHVVPQATDRNKTGVPPSFAESEFQTIVRRQRHGNDPDGLKIRHSHSHSPRTKNDWEFAGWGSMSYLAVSSEDVQSSEDILNAPRKLFGQLRATSIAGNGVSGGVFYTFPAVIAVAGIYSPLCLALAASLLLFLRPLLLELAAAVRLNGANYMYLLQFSGKPLSILGAAATLLDAIATSTVSSATASTYLHDELSNFPVSLGVLAIVFLLAIGILVAIGGRDSNILSASVFVFHLATVVALIVASIVYWARMDPGSSVLRSNWALRPANAIGTVKAIFYGTCIAFLGVTGFETTPTYIERMQPQTYSSVLRNLVFLAGTLDSTLCLFCLAILPHDVVTGGNVLSILAETAADGKWLRYWVVVDAVCVLLGGILTGYVASGELIERLARDHVLPQIFLAHLPVTNGAYVATAFSTLLAIVLWLASGMDVNTASGTFSVAFLLVMLLFAVSNATLKYNHPHVPRSSKAPFWALLGSLIFLSTTWAGNIAMSPSVLKAFAPAIIIICLAFLLLDSQPRIARLALRFVYPSADGSRMIPRLCNRYLLKWYKRSRSTRVCVWIKDDDIHTMLQAILSIQRNEPDASTIVFVHAYPAVEQIPTELQPNTQLLDEAFPSITIDLSFVQGIFSPPLVHASSQALNIPMSRMSVVRLGSQHHWSLGDYNGVRIIA